MNKLIGKRAIITSDNENYNSFTDTILIITHASNKGVGYDSSVYPQMLCDFSIEGDQNREFPFALYEHEFKII